MIIIDLVAIYIIVTDIIDRNWYSILHYNFKISVRIFFFFFLRQLLITDHTRVPAQVNRILFFLIWGTLMFWWGLYGWTPLSCPWGCLVRSARVWTFWFFLVPWLPLGLGDFLVVLLGWSSVLGLRIVGGLTLWWLSPLCLACIGMLIHPYLSYYTNVFGSSLVFLFGWKMWRINSNVRDS